MPNSYSSRVLSNTQIGTEIFLMVIESREISSSSNPGNFVQIKINLGTNIFWRRPFSILETDNGNFSILYKIAGRGTKALSQIKSGDSLNIIGPLGNQFSLPDKKDRVLLIGGGIGIPPLYFWAKRLLELGYGRTDIHFFNGAKNNLSLTYLNQIADLGINVYPVTEDGSIGTKGVVIDELNHFLSKNNVPTDRISAFSCGPTAMLKSVAETADRYGINCELALETLMPCGFGICMSCAIKVRDATDMEGFNYRRVCRDGPIFKSQEILWE